MTNCLVRETYENTLCLPASLCPKSFDIKVLSYGKYFISVDHACLGITLKQLNFDLLYSYMFLIEGLLLFLSNLFISWSKFIVVNLYICPHFSIFRHPQLLHIYSAIWYVVTLLTDRCDLLQLFHSYSSCATRSARLQLCRLHVSVSANDRLWSNLEICKLISLTNANQWIESLSSSCCCCCCCWSLFSHKFSCWLYNSGEDKTFFAGSKRVRHVYLKFLWLRRFHKKTHKSINFIADRRVFLVFRYFDWSWKSVKSRRSCQLRCSWLTKLMKWTN